MGAPSCGRTALVTNPMKLSTHGNALVLISLPGSRHLRRVLSQLRTQAFGWAYLGQNISEFYRVRRAFDSQGTHVDTTSRFHQAAEALREPYLAYLYTIGQQLDSLRWWITPLSYRCVYVSKTLHRTCDLKVALSLAETWEGAGPLVLVVTKPVLQALKRNLPPEWGKRVRVLQRPRPFSVSLIGDAASMLAHRAFFVLREGYRILQSRLTLSRPNLPAQPTTVLVSWATPTNISRGGEFHQSFFGDLAAQLVSGGHQVAVAPIILPGVRYREALLRLRNASLPLLVPHRYLSVMDLVRAAISSCIKPPLPSALPDLDGMDIRNLVQEDLTRHWVGNGAADALLMAASVRRWAAARATITRIIYVYENQPLERALIWETRRSFPKAMLVGFQHAGVPRLLLNFYLSPGGEKRAPLPDRIVTVGKHTAQLLSADGYEPGQVRVGGALQMQDLIALRSKNSESDAPGHRPLVLVAASNGLEETAELAYMAAQLFREEEGIDVVMKCHPIMPFEKVVQFTGNHLPKHVRLSNEPIIELMQKSSVMVYSGSTVGVHALALSLPVIHLRTQFEFDLDPLEAVPHLRLEATGLEDLRQKVRWLLVHREEYIAQHLFEWDRLVDDMYGQVDQETIRAFTD